MVFQKSCSSQILDCLASYKSHSKKLLRENKHIRHKFDILEVTLLSCDGFVCVTCVVSVSASCVTHAAKQ
jgi:hypothetical protein